MSKTVILSSTRDVPLLLFLWKWKFASTATIATKYFPGQSLKTAYNRLHDLKMANLIHYQTDSELEHFVWTLTKKGFAAVRQRLPQLKQYGCLSEHLAHDLIVNAVHLGDWLIEKPSNVDLFSEQELRRYHEELYPEWVPRCQFDDTHQRYHRPDGYWRIPDGDSKIIVALEVERTLQKNSRYKDIAYFYSSNNRIYRVLWIVNRPSMATEIAAKFANFDKENFEFHNFVYLKEFLENGWQARIQIGSEKGKTISYLLNHNHGKDRGSLLHTSLIDTRKYPSNLTTYKHSNTTTAIV